MLDVAVEPDALLILRRCVSHCEQSTAVICAIERALDASKSGTTAIVLFAILNASEWISSDNL
jgi:hypothetical protein